MKLVQKNEAKIVKNSDTSKLLERKFMRELLPLGSVVALYNGTKKLMVIGRIQKAVESDEVYDYSACLWPQGYINKDYVYLFNQEDIRCLYHIGHQDTEEFNFRFILDEEMKKIEK